jgi:hypothetical protein
LGQIADRLQTGTLKVGVAPTDLGGVEHVLRSVANRVGAAIIVVGLLLRVHDLQWLGFAGVWLASLLGLYMVWKIVRTPGELQGSFTGAGCCRLAREALLHFPKS